MRHSTRSAALLILLVAAACVAWPLPAAQAGTATLDAAAIREQVLPNGLRVIVRPSHAAGLVSLQYWVRAGVFLEDEKSAGTAHFIEHMLFKGTETRPQGAVDAEIEDLGGVLEAETDKDWTTLRATVATAFWTKALGVIADTVQHPRLRLEDLEAERPIILDEIASAGTDPSRVLVNRLFQYALPDHPYRFLTTGTPENVRQIKLGPLRDYFRKYYTPANSLLVVVGDVTPEAVLQQARTLFPGSGGVGTPTPGPAGTPAAPPMPPSAKAAPPKGLAGDRRPRRQVLTTDFRGGYYGVAFPAPSVRQVPDVYAMDVLVTMLEQGPTGRLPLLLRDQARLAKADFQTRRDPGLLTIRVSTTPDRLEQVEKSVLEEIGRLRATPPPSAEVEATKSILTGTYALDNETFAGQGNTLGYYAAIDRWQFASSYLENIAKVTPEQVHAVAVKYLVPEQSTTVILRPRGEDAR
jgi:zinc protease